MDKMSEERLGGTLLVASAVILIFAGLIRPGGILVDHADQTHFTHVIEAMVNNPLFTHLSAFSGSVGLLLMLGGLLLARRSERWATNSRIQPLDWASSSS